MVMLGKHEQLILRITRGFLLLALAIPLVYSSDYMLPFVTTKVFFVRSIILLALAGYFTLVMIAPERYIPRRSLLMLVTGAWFAWLMVSTILGVDPAFSWWGNYERMGGVFTVLHYGALFVMMSTLFRDAHSWRAVWWVIVGVGFLVAMGAVIQQFNRDFLFGGARAASTLGNPIYLSVYAGYVVAIGLFLLGVLRESGAIIPRGLLARVAQLFILVTVIGMALALAWSETRAAILGVGAAFVWIAAWLAVMHEDRRARMGALGVLVLILIGAAVFTWGGPTLERIPAFRRVAQFSLGDTVATRLRTWRVGIEAWKDYPIVGWGWMNFGPAYDLHYDPDQLKHGLNETWLDHAHNVLVETVTTTGIVGLFVYLAWWVVLLWTLFGAYRRGQVNNMQWSLMSGLLVFHFVQNLFSFDQPTSYVMLFTVAAWVATHDGRDASPIIHMTAFPARHAFKAAGIIAVVALVTVYYTNVIPAKANRLQIQGEGALGRGEVGVWFGLYEQALGLPTPHKSDIISRMASGFLERKANILPLDRQSVDKLVTAIVREAGQDVNEHPNRIGRWLTYGKILSVQHEAFRTEHPDAGPAAVRAYEHALTLSPRRQQAAIIYGTSIMAVEDFERARQILLAARSWSPNITEIHTTLAPIFFRAGQFTDALASYEAAILVAGTPQLPGGDLNQWQEIGLLHIEYGDPLRGAWFLDTVMSCATRKVSWRVCAEDGDPEILSKFRPSRKAFGALVLYYRKKGDLEKSAFYEDLARSYYADFTVRDGPIKASSGT